MFHAPVLCDEAVDALVVEGAWTYVDGTVGGGGHALRVGERLGAAGRLICFDADADALAEARTRLASLGDRVTFVHANYSAIGEILRQSGAAPLGGVLLDLGVSSHQVDAGPRGFSFRADEPLDMRMDRRQALSARDVVNGYEETRLADVLWRFGEERMSRRIARRIVARRPLETTGALRDAVASVAGGPHLVKSLARVFQALRIEVNAELDHLAATLEQLPSLLRPGGRIVVIAYHSLEDRLVKDFFRREAATHEPSGNRLLPDRALVPRLRVVTRKPVVASEEEVERNPRARSAKMRVAERTEAAG
jgi:16S rRNA (cytosine1402-N4)-methyltransferase